MTESGAAAMAAFICFLVNTNGFEIGFRFMFVTIAAGNDSDAVFTLRPNKEDNSITKPAETLQALLSLYFDLIFHRDHRGIKYAANIGQINAVFLNIPLTLNFIPNNHG